MLPHFLGHLHGHTLPAFWDGDGIVSANSRVIVKTELELEVYLVFNAVHYNVNEMICIKVINQS